MSCQCINTSIGRLLGSSSVRHGTLLGVLGGGLAPSVEVLFVARAVLVEQTVTLREPVRAQLPLEIHNASGVRLAAK